MPDLSDAPETPDPAARAPQALRWRLPERCAPLLHGGAHALPHDFSTNTHPAGPLPAVARAVRAAARHRYPPADDPALRQAIGRLHAVDEARVLLLPSASAGLHLLARAAADWAGLGEAVWPTPGYGEYAAACAAAGLRRVEAWGAAAGVAAAAFRAGGPHPDRLHLWAEPSSPDGRSDAAALRAVLDASGHDLVLLDLAYQPMRLDGDPAAEAAMAAGAWAPAGWLARGLPHGAARAWQLWSPNKACGLTGVRGAYALAPEGAQAVAAALRAAQPSWPLGADGRAMLQAWAAPATQQALAASLARVRRWRADLARVLQRAGWSVEPDGVSPFLVARAPVDRPWDADRARAAGVALRATDSLGLPGAWRLCARPPRALRALAALLADGQGQDEAAVARPTAASAAPATPLTIPADPTPLPRPRAAPPR
ncbi:aminotransferase class I/II-fold pyridoxal phosphate-dependent enzyme [Pseudaquabacterium rugosum]|uniref:histidinol-phosphate transaminase n=1 Tax=Pseudaquabacterium rugosum TaxID=2984194 RepID=A0ABU9BH50_9BURK